LARKERQKRRRKIGASICLFPLLSPLRLIYV
jgi:hypothetical protein